MDLEKSTANFFPAGKAEVKMTNQRGGFISTIQSSYINYAKGRLRATFISVENRPVQFSDLPIKLLLYVKGMDVIPGGETFQTPGNLLYYLVHELLPYF